LILRGKDYSLRDIASALDRAVSSISDEIRINSVSGEYDPKKANYKARLRRTQASYRGKKIVGNDKLREFVDGALSDGQSAEAIAGRLKYQEKHLPYASKDTIYRYLKSPYGKLIGIKWKKKIKPKKSRKVTRLKDRIFIDKRPIIIEKRGRVGDMEGDFIVSGRSGKVILLTTVCRKLRMTFVELISEVTTDEVHQAFARIKKRFPEMKTLTLDNDILFRMHKTLEKLLNVKIYFCHPYHSWEKGSIENVNMEIRKFIPKGSDLSRYDSESIRAIEDHINGRFMGCLKYATPEEKLRQYRKTKNSPVAAEKIIN
jgi:transposase, IS30 family